MIALLAALALAGAPPEATRPAEPGAPAPDVGWDGFALWQARGTVTNVGSTNPLLDGQVVGALGGTNATTVLDGERAVFVEQRLNLFARYAPPLLDGHAELGGALEVDFTWGDQSYGTGGNTGGGFGADQVNLQTRRLYAAFQPTLGADDTLRIVTGLQLLTDSVNDPTRATADELLRSGGRFAILGSEAAGGRHLGRRGDLVRYRVGAFTLWESALGAPDDVWVAVADVELRPAYRTSVGVHAWGLIDRSGGGAGTLGVGPTSALSELQGGPRLDLRADGALEAPDVYTDLAWLAVDGGYDPSLTGGPLGLHGVAVANLGRMVVGPGDSRPIRGALAQGEARWRYAPGSGSVLKLEGAYTTRDNPTDDSRYEGVLTANAYGVVGAMSATHGCHLLLPDPGAINRQAAVVYDLSGRGEGLVLGAAELGYDPVPDRVTVAAGAAQARNTSGQLWGTELHGRIVTEPWSLLEVGLSAAYVFAGERAKLDGDPWTVFLSTQWLVP